MRIVEKQGGIVENKKDLHHCKSLIYLVARGGIEPPTQGFSIFMK
jgi:hypothetical protein